MFYSDHVVFHAGSQTLGSSRPNITSRRKGFFSSSNSTALLHMVNPYFRRAKNSFRRLKFTTKFAVFPIAISILIAFFVSSNTQSPSLSIESSYTPVSPDPKQQYSNWEIKTSKFGMDDVGSIRNSKTVYARAHKHSSSTSDSPLPPIRVDMTNPLRSVDGMNRHEDLSLMKGSKKPAPHIRPSDHHPSDHPHSHDRHPNHHSKDDHSHDYHSIDHRLSHSSHHHQHRLSSKAFHKEGKHTPKKPGERTTEGIKHHKVVSAPHPLKATKPILSHVKHGHRRFQFSETKFTQLPDTKLLFEREFTTFKPVRSRTTDVRLISLSDVCYCTQRNKFLVPRLSRDKKTKFPGYLYRYGYALSVSWKRQQQILASPHQKVVHVDGTTIIWRGRSIHTYSKHLQSSLIPIRSLLDVVKKTKYNEKVRIAAESFTPPPGQESVVRKAYNYFLGDIPEENRIEFAHLRPRLLCFDRVLALGSEYEGHAKSVESYENVKGLIEKHESSVLKGKLARSCKDAGSTKSTIWVLERHEQHTHGGTISNAPEVREAIMHELVRAHLDKKVNIQFVQSPSISCPMGTARAGCFDSICSRDKPTRVFGKDEDCRHHPSILPEVQLFNKMTFLVTVTGRANEGVIYMPRGSQVIEVVPHGILDHSFESLAKDAHLKHSRLENRLYKDSEWLLLDRFGDIARNEHSCWGDIECRQFRQTRATHVDVHHLKLLIRKALLDWTKTCEV